MLGMAVQWISIPFRGEKKQSQSFNATQLVLSCGSMGHQDRRRLSFNPSLFPPPLTSPLLVREEDWKSNMLFAISVVKLNTRYKSDPLWSQISVIDA